MPAIPEADEDVLDYVAGGVGRSDVLDGQGVHGRDVASENFFEGGCIVVCEAGEEMVVGAGKRSRRNVRVVRTAGREVSGVAIPTPECEGRVPPGVHEGMSGMGAHGKTGESVRGSGSSDAPHIITMSAREQGRSSGEELLRRCGKVGDLLESIDCPLNQLRNKPAIWQSPSDGIWRIIED